MGKDQTRLGRWYFGGLASAGAASCTHPLDLLKVHLQTSSQFTASGQSGNLLTITISIIRNQGFFALYNGLSASLLRQLTYSTTRFGIYEIVKQRLLSSQGSSGLPNFPFHQKVLVAACAGFSGGVVGTPADLINVRMQNDIKLPLDMRRNYKNAFHGLYRVYKDEGVKRLFNGATTAASRAALISIGQLSMYDQFKFLLLQNFSSMFKDNLVTHFTSSLAAGIVATTITQPLDVIKTRLMNAAPGEINGIIDCAKSVFKQYGLFGFFKGYIPAFIRLGPHTILTFVFLEQLRLRFGYFPTLSK